MTTVDGETLNPPVGVFGAVGPVPPPPHAARVRSMTALSNTSVRVDLDSNGDGTPEATVTKPWSTFE